MNFSINPKLSRALSLILALGMLTTLFSGCKKNTPAEDTSEPNFNLNLNISEPTETDTPAETTEPPVINENTATVLNQMNIRSMPSMEGTIVGTLYAGDRIEVKRREEVHGTEWLYIISPESGWVVSEYIQMDIPTTETPSENTDTPAGETKPAEDNKDDKQETNIKGVINANGLNIRSEPSTTTGKVQGAYNKGDVVTILETKNGWGRTNKGWIKMDYVNTTGSNSTTNNNNKDEDKKDEKPTVTITGNGSTTVQFRGIVTASELNVRADADQSATRVGSLKYGARVEILEKSGTWGRTKNGWISLNYVYQDGATGTKTGTGTITGDELNIRSGPGTGYGSVGSYNKGDRVTILEQFTYNGVTWGCTNKGWISMQYCQLDGAANNNTNTNVSKAGTVTGDGLNIRSGAGTGYGVVGTLNKGDRVTVLSTTVVEGVTWGQISNGWVSMAYVKLD